MYNEDDYYGPMDPEHAHVMNSASEVKALGFGDHYHIIAIKCGKGWMLSGTNEIWDHAHLIGFASITYNEGTTLVSDDAFDDFMRNATCVMSVGKDYMVDLANNVMYFKNLCLRPGEFEEFCKSDSDFKWWDNKPEYK